MVRLSPLKFWRAAYSLIEIMLVLASLSVVVGGGIYAIGKARQSSAETKLKQDVQRLNPVHVIIAGVIGAAMFIGVLLLVVKWVVGSGVAS